MRKKEIEIIIDHLHRQANQDIKHKSLKEYMSYFSDDLEYTQLDGKIIGKQQLAQDQKKYWSRVLKMNSQYERLDSQLEDGLFTETLSQVGTIWIRVFLFFRKKWAYRRKGIYVWEQIEGQWKICEVTILDEKIS